MKQHFKGWDQVACNLRELADSHLGVAPLSDWSLNDGQRASLRAIADRIPYNGIVIADEVGMGKTRIAVALARCVVRAGGRVAILVPPGLGYQWGDELRAGDVSAPDILRSLWQYLTAWASAKPGEQDPWFGHDVVLISHAFTNWRLGAGSDVWRWSLLPDLYVEWRLRTSGRLPRRTAEHKAKSDPWTRNAAKSIADRVLQLPRKQPAPQVFDGLADLPWPGALKAVTYSRDQSLRPRLEKAVGLGLGLFDLIIIDEAHKSRGEESGLSRLCEHVVLSSEDARRLAVTATPVELDVSQWKQTLARIQVDTSKIEPTIADYANAVHRVRQCPSNDAIRTNYETSARAFHDALTPYLLRRDKREDPTVRLFERASKTRIHAYRRETPITIDTLALPEPWKRVICAAEALSHATGLNEDATAKRLRLTIGNGHGLTDRIDSAFGNDVDDPLLSNTKPDPSVGETQPPDKRLQRALWWKNVIACSLPDSRMALYEHPAILAATKAIEAQTALGQKVLVFGRFTRPMQALVRLLNAREMFRCLDTGRRWAQEKVPEDERVWDAVCAAHTQLTGEDKLDRMLLDARLSLQYKKFEGERAQYLEDLIKNLESGMSELTNSPRESNRTRVLFNAFRQSLLNETDSGRHTRTLTLVANAMREFTGPHTEMLEARDYAEAFAELMRALSDRDEGDANGDGELDSTEAAELWLALRQRIDDEYRAREGDFVRLLHGETKPETRRYLQLAFNRQSSQPQVLVAQSVVGREGLNLHKACRIVLLLHPEWNPGVVEQQIGRVDRLGSRWQRELEAAIQQKCPAEELPRIEIWPLIFKGTYDELNWQVLRRRWDQLRAQLHGVVIPEEDDARDSKLAETIDAINLAAPNFSPLSLERI